MLLHNIIYLMSNGRNDEIYEFYGNIPDVMELDNGSESSKITRFPQIEVNDNDAYTKRLQEKLENSNEFSGRNNSELKTVSRKPRLIQKKKRETSNASRREIIRAVKRLRKKFKKFRKQNSSRKILLISGISPKKIKMNFICD